MAVDMEDTVEVMEVTVVDTVDTAVAVMADLLMPNPKPKLKPNLKPNPRPNLLLLLKLMPKLMPMLTMAMADTVDTDTAVDADMADTVMAVAITARDLPNLKLTATVMAVDTVMAVTAVVMVDTVDTADTTDKLLEDQVTRIQIKIHSCLLVMH